jgi:DUF4097 and DUF4098 domain-containing protein YvlB
MRYPVYRTVLLLLLGVFLLVSSCSDDVSGPGGDSVATESFYYRFQVFEQVLLAVSGINGEITITGSAWSDSIVVRGIKRVKSFSIDDALEHLDSLDVEVKNEAGVVSAETDQPDDSDGRTYEVDYEIIIPTDLAVTVSDVNGTISIDSVAKPISAQTVNGTIELDEILASVTGSVVNGRIEGDVTLPPDAIVTMSIVNGEIDMDFPTSTSAMFSASVVNGTISVYNLPLQDIVSTANSLTGTLGQGRGTISLSAVNGTVSVRGF